MTSELALASATTAAIVVIAVMLVIIALGLAVDRLVFSQMELRVRERWGLA